MVTKVTLGKHYEITLIIDYHFNGNLQAVVSSCSCVHISDNVCFDLCESMSECVTCTHRFSSQLDEKLFALEGDLHYF